MKIEKNLQNLLVLCLVFAALLGCSTENGNQALDAEPSAPISTSSPVPTSIAVETQPTATEIQPTAPPNTTPYQAIIPTITNLHQQLLLLALYDQECIFPCYLGINIDEMSIDEALLRLQDLGGTLRYGSPTSYDSGLKQYAIRLDILRDGNELIHSIYLLSDGDDIIRLDVGIENRIFPDFVGYWSRYFVDNILTVIDDPEYIFLYTVNYEPTYSIHLFDTTHGIQYAMIRLKNDGLICPQDVSKIWFIGFTIYDIDYVDEINTVDHWLWFNPEDYTPISDQIGLSDREFITQLRDGTMDCFEVED